MSASSIGSSGSSPGLRPAPAEPPSTPRGSNSGHNRKVSSSTLDTTTNNLVVRIIEARNLAHGASDAYCRVSFGTQKPRSTKPVRKTLSPVWEEHFMFALEDPLPTEVLIEVLDKSLLSHKRLGRVQISMSEIGTHRDHDVWLPLQAKKEADTVTGDVHVMLRCNVPDPPVFEAIKNGEVEQVRRLISEPDFDFLCIDASGYTPLHFACLHCEINFDMLHVLLTHPGVDVNVRSRNEGNTPLHYFCLRWRSPAVDKVFELFMSKNANVNASNDSGETPLHKAVLNTSIRGLLVQALIKCGADCNISSKKLGMTALHYAVHLNREDLVMLLLRGGARLDLRAGRTPQTPLEVAQEMKFDDMVSLLQGAEAITTVSNQKHDLGNWLKALRLEQYMPQFVANDFYLDTLPALNLSELDLERAGITSVGHQKALINAIRQLKPRDRMSIMSTLGSPVGGSGTKRPMSLKEQLEKMKYVKQSNFIECKDVELITRVGAGASGEVFRGLWKNQVVAIKVLNMDLIEEFVKEFQIMSAVESKYTVFLFGVVLKPLYMVMEMCSHGSLHTVLSDRSIDVGWDRAFRFAIEMTKGLVALHNNDPQVLHRDFKSPNILIDSDWHCKVSDFGTARFDDNDSMKTLRKSDVGSAPYMAPENFAGERFTTKADVFAVGIVLWEIVQRCINGRYLWPYEEFKFRATGAIHMRKDKGLRPTIPASCPEKLVELINACWNHDPALRPEASGVLERLEELERDWQDNRDAWERTRIPTDPVD
eukprot:TRINITY_DN2951_c0_g3_i1.p1 TRINITY_DN2951_c0_g3~~TRINITY_DN2951_c0_g3_i1.p1  ORF type:complete len:765 (-),score=279.05 TRINITY_DN2951_c0_g3_i1:553-2847(-)